MPGTLPPERWNACIELLSRSLEELDSLQRAAALVFHYYGRVMNGGHSLHFDYEFRQSDAELLAALELVGAHEHAKIYAEALRRRREIHPATREEEDMESQYIESQLDGAFDRLRPNMEEILEAYFVAHPESFPSQEGHSLR